MSAEQEAAVLREIDAHRPTYREYTGGWWELACTGCDFAKGRRLSHLDWAPHHAHRAEVFEAALSAAGYGLVADAKREAWDEGYGASVMQRYGIIPNPRNPYYQEDSNDDQ